MNDPKLPAQSGGADDSQLPEVRLELTQAGVRQVLSLYAEEQAGRLGRGGMQIGLDDILRAAWEHKWMVALCLIVGCLLGAGVLFVATPMYALTAEVVLERQDPVETVLSTGQAGSAFIATQAEIMQSRSVVEAAVTGLGARAVGGSEDPAAAVAAALEALQASPVSGTQVVALSYLGPDAGYGADLLAATVAAYRERLKDDERHNQAQRLQARETEYNTLLDEVRRMEAALDAMRRSQLEGVSVADAVEAQNQIIRNQTQQIAEARQQRMALESRLLAGSMGALADDPVTRSLRDRLFQAEAELGRVTQTLNAGHPTREAATRTVQTLRSQLAAAEQATPRLLQREIEAAKRLEAELALLLESERARLSETERLRREEQRLIDDLAQTQVLVEQRRRALLDQRLVSRLAENGEVGITARMIAEPVIPLAPSWPNPLLVFAIGSMLGLLVGLTVAVMRLRRNEAGLMTDAPRSYAGGYRL